MFGFVLMMTMIAFASAPRSELRWTFPGSGLAEIVTAEGDLRTLPCHLPDPDTAMAGLDGFYAARLERE